MRNLCILLTLSLCLVGVSWGAPPRPNIIIIFTDDQGYADLGCYGSGSAPATSPWKSWDRLAIKTPRIDRMAEEGVLFTSFYSGYRVCTQSRMALLTGCYVQRLGYGQSRVLRPDDKIGINQNEITIARLLKGRGYATACIGKWHVGHKKPFLPTSNGFDRYFGIPYSNDMNWDPQMDLAEDIVWREGYTQSKFRSGKLAKNKVPLLRDTAVVEFPVDQSTLTRRYTDEVIRFVKENKDSSFFVYLAHSMPHTPLYPSEQFKGTSIRGTYGDVIEEIDWNTGRIIDTIKSLGLDSTTMIIFTSDNGPWLKKGDNGGTAYPLRAGKTTNWEGGMRVPCIMRWPGSIPARSVQKEFASLIDVYPTISGLTGYGLPKNRIIDGLDIWPIISMQEGAANPHEAFYYDLGAARKGQYKLKDGRLYDLENDVHEDKDVSAQHPEVKKELSSLLNKFKTSMGSQKRSIGTLSTTVLAAGCTDPAALNYDAAAQNDDGSCIPKIPGCMDRRFKEYNPDATVPDEAACHTIDVTVPLKRPVPSGITLQGAALRISGAHKITVYDLAGHLVLRREGNGSRIYSRRDMGVSGVLLARIRTGGGQVILKWPGF